MSAVVTGDGGFDEKRRKFRTERLPTPEEASFIRRFLGGWRGWGNDNRVRVHSLPDQSDIHIVPDQRTLMWILRDLGASPRRPVIGASLGPPWGVLIAGDSRPDEKFTTIGHEISHEVLGPGGWFAGSQLALESLADLVTGHIFQKYTPASDSKVFRPGYLGIAIVMDELIGEAGGKFVGRPNTIFNGIIRGQIQGDNSWGEGIIRTVLGPDRWRTFGSAEVDGELLDEVLDIVGALGLDGAIRRIHRLNTHLRGRPPGVDDVLRNADKTDRPPPPRPLTPDERSRYLGQDPRPFPGDLSGFVDLSDLIDQRLADQVDKGRELEEDWSTLDDRLGHDDPNGDPRGPNDLTSPGGDGQLDPSEPGVHPPAPNTPDPTDPANPTEPTNPADPTQPGGDGQPDPTDPGVQPPEPGAEPDDGAEPGNGTEDGVDPPIDEHTPSDEQGGVIRDPPIHPSDPPATAGESEAQRLARRLQHIDSEEIDGARQLVVGGARKFTDAMATLRRAILLADAAYQDAQQREKDAERDLAAAQADEQAAHAVPDAAAIAAAQQRAEEAQVRLEQARTDQEHLKDSAAESSPLVTAIKRLDSARRLAEGGAGALRTGSESLHTYAAVAVGIPIDMGGFPPPPAGQQPTEPVEDKGYTPYGAWPSGAPFVPDPEPDDDPPVSGAPPGRVAGYRVRSEKQFATSDCGERTDGAVAGKFVETKPFPGKQPSDDRWRSGEDVQFKVPGCALDR
jgi:hypothetical protein